MNNSAHLLFSSKHHLDFLVSHPRCTSKSPVQLSKAMVTWGLVPYVLISLTWVEASGITNFCKDPQLLLMCSQGENTGGGKASVCGSF